MIRLKYNELLRYVVLSDIKISRIKNVYIPVVPIGALFHYKMMKL